MSLNERVTRFGLRKVAILRHTYAFAQKKFAYRTNYLAGI